MRKKHRNDRRNIDGLILINKDPGLTSNAVLQKVLKLLNAQKGGHTGSLDPFATGMLPICLGEATKVSSFFLNSDKSYTATLSLGKATTTGDLTGDTVIQQEIPKLTEEKISSIFKEMEGEQLQIPPMFSALKHKGKPLYEYARQGINIERQARPINIYQLNLLSINGIEITFKVFCSKGTYVRTLAEQISRMLGTVGHLVALHRTQVGSLPSDMLSLSELKLQIQDNILDILPIDIGLGEYKSVILNDKEVEFIRHGGMLDKDCLGNSYVKLYNEQGHMIAMGEWHEKTHRLKAKRVFNF